MEFSVEDVNCIDSCASVDEQVDCGHTATQANEPVPDQNQTKKVK